MQRYMLLWITCITKHVLSLQTLRCRWLISISILGLGHCRKESLRMRLVQTRGSASPCMWWSLMVPGCTKSRLPVPLGHYTACRVSPRVSQSPTVLGRCDHCHSTATKIVGSAKPLPEELWQPTQTTSNLRCCFFIFLLAGWHCLLLGIRTLCWQEEHFHASQVEIAQCSACGQQTRFPRAVPRICPNKRIWQRNPGDVACDLSLQKDMLFLHEPTDIFIRYTKESTFLVLYLQYSL